MRLGLQGWWSVYLWMALKSGVKLWEEGKLDLDAPVQKYVPEFREKMHHFLYSTHTFTLLSVVVARAAGQRLLDHIMKMFRPPAWLPQTRDSPGSVGMVDKTEASWDKDGLYAQVWLVVEKEQKYSQCRSHRHYISHTGGAMEASSAQQPKGLTTALPQGIVVTIITNMQSVGLDSTALKIAHEFDKARG
ncbi:unnamed protein product [Coregonus sp. 'balchen']|nr:unnamed protein product [Coregonus sp. 'balchen']